MPDHVDTDARPVPFVESVFAHALDAVVMMDDQGRVTAWNPSAESLFGWTAEEAIGREMGALIVPEEFRKAHVDGLKRYLETGEGPVLNKRISVRATNRQGLEFPVELAVVPIADGGGKRFIGFIRSLLREEEEARQRADRVAEAEVVASIASAQLSGLPVDEFAKVCLGRLCDVTGWSAAHFYMVDNIDAPTELRPTNIWHFADDSLESMRDVTRTHRFAIGEGLPGMAWEAGDMVLLENLIEETRFSRREAFHALGLRKGFAFPIWEGDLLSGVMEFYGPRTARSDANLRILVRTVASHISLALQKSRQVEFETILMRETQHRLGNSLAILSSMFRRCAMDAETVEDLVERFEPRLQTVAAAYTLQIQAASRPVPLVEVLSQALGLLPDEADVRLVDSELALGPNAIPPFALVFGELVTNSLKHGVWHQQKGHLGVSWGLMNEGGWAYLDWTETPSEPPPSGMRQGYGSTLLEAMITRSLNGRFDRSWEDGQLRIRIEWPIGGDGSLTAS